MDYEDADTYTYELKHAISANGRLGRLRMDRINIYYAETEHYIGENQGNGQNQAINFKFLLANLYRNGRDQAMNQ